MKAKLSKWQYQVANDEHRFKVICAGRRSGKSVLARLLLLKWAVETPGVYYLVSPTYKQAKAIHWHEAKKEIPQSWIKATNQTELSFTLKNGSIIELKGAENPDALRGVKLRGLVVDEIASIRNWGWLWGEVLRPTLTDYEAPAIFISTPKGYNHFYDMLVAINAAEAQYDSQWELKEVQSSDSETYQKTLRNLAAIKAQIAKLKAQYNADAEKEETIGQFKANNLPERVDVAPHKYENRTGGL